MAVAGQHIAELEAGIDTYPDGFRQSLAIEAALFAALERKDADAAAAWLARAKGGVVDDARRALAEAAELAVRNDLETADARLRYGLSRLSRSSDPGLADMTRRQLLALQSRLETSTPVTSSPHASSAPAGPVP